MKTNTSWVLVLLVMVAGMRAVAAEAAYFRFWRGGALPSLNAQEFRAGLNEKLLPATAELARSAARLRSYQPVLIDRALAAKPGLPAEVALVEYESEDTYKAYRATPEGKAYGDLHWEMFARETSGSLVPAPFSGTAEIGKAYEVGSGESNWNTGFARFRWLERRAGSSDAEYVDTVAAHLKSAGISRAISVKVLVAQGYALEYALYDREQDAPKGACLRALMDIELPRGLTIDYGQGVRRELRP